MIRNNYLNPYVISKPEITFVKRNVDDEYLILASGDFWDMVSSETACLVARECLEEDAIFYSKVN
ncbi:hypothetical protein H5410_026826 [Solanum commersonii]|uniref:PPM-type phosphatase domain-containing protein n=1 Tax=Solanum commersonii TaxID=4109 RepID=A0A9J5Z2N7_SOLCO|nr:hypothetical protein H5410_026826 [Solanum commersonii]